MQTLTENKVMSRVFPIIAGTIDIFSQENLRFTNLKNLIDSFIIKSQSDLYDGVRPEKLNKQIRDELGFYIVLSTNTVASYLPNFFTKTKDFKKITDVCKRQTLYNGALDARGIHKLRLYIDSETTYNNNAYTIASTYYDNSEALKLYTTHCTLSINSNRDYEYRITQLNSWNITGNPDIFRQETSVLRNTRDLTKKNRKELIAAANSKTLSTKHLDLILFTQSFVLLLSNEIIYLESETSADELVLNLDTFTSFSYRTSVRAQTSLSFKIFSNQQFKKTSQVNKRSSRRSEVSEFDLKLHETARSYQKFIFRDISHPRYKDSFFIQNLCIRQTLRNKIFRSNTE